MVKAPLSCYELRRAYWVLWLPSLAYYLPYSYMCKKPVHLVQKKMTSTSISKRGYSLQTLHAAVFGPQPFLRISNPHLYPEQAFGGTLQLLKHTRSYSKLDTSESKESRSPHISPGFYLVQPGIFQLMRHMVA